MVRGDDVCAVYPTGGGGFCGAAKARRVKTMVVAANAAAAGPRYARVRVAP
ncbi:MAG: hypothetical protein JRN62_09120 [Nitrososphaerota archaeon]|nr:hypothetical protein [Nitrososphaerota archaeon]